jgi:hypothetical protein
MTSEICNLALEKAKQAGSYLESMVRVWDAQTPESEGLAAEEEFAHQLGEFMRACQGAISCFEQDPKCGDWARNFNKSHSEFYARSTGYGSVPVRMHPSKSQGKGHQSSADTLARGPREHGPRQWGQRGVRLKNKLYFPSDSGETIIQLCSEHLHEVNTFIQQVCP